MIIWTTIIIPATTPANLKMVLKKVKNPLPLTLGILVGFEIVPKIESIFFRVY